MNSVVTIAVSAVIVVFPLSSADSGQSESGPTYARDVAPILFKSCAACHRPGEVAPMSLLSYQEVRPWARSIRVKVLNGEMPPWHADPNYGKFRDDRRLTPQEIDTIVKWVDAGAPQGDDANLPPKPQFVDGWQGGQPDYVLEMPEFKVPAEGEVPQLYFWVRNPFKENRFVEAAEIRPGNASVVHHARVDVVDLPEGCSVVDGLLIGPDGKRIIAKSGGVQDVPDESGQRFFLASYTPGHSLERFLPGTGKRLSAGKWIRFNLHYQPAGSSVTDQTKLGVWFGKAPVAHEVFTRIVGQSLPGDSVDTPFIVGGKEIGATPEEASSAQDLRADGRPPKRKIPNIPPYADNWKIVGFTLVSEPITVYSLWPHMHLRGKDMTYVVTYPDGREEIVLRVPRYDFNWQLQYTLEAPLKLPAGSKITSIAHYDNSIMNKYNPGPDKEVFWSEQSWDEMFAPFIEYSVDRLSLTRRPKLAGQVSSLWQSRGLRDRGGFSPRSR